MPQQQQRSPPERRPRARRRATKSSSDASLRSEIVRFSAANFLDVWHRQQVSSGTNSSKGDDHQPSTTTITEDLDLAAYTPADFVEFQRGSSGVAPQKLAPTIDSNNNEAAVVPSITSEFPRHDCVLATADGRTIRANRALLTANSYLLRLEFAHLPDNASEPPVVQLPINYAPLASVVASMYYREAGAATANDTNNNTINEETLAMLKNAELPLLLEIFNAAVRLNVPYLVDLVGGHLFERATPSTYVITYHHLKVFCPALAEQLWSKIVAEFYRICQTRTHKLLTLPEIRRALFEERINIAHGDEIRILRSWAKLAHPGAQEDEIQAMREDFEERLVGSIANNQAHRLPYSLLFALGGWGATGPTDRLEIFNGYTEDWIEPRAPLGDLPNPRCYYAAVPMPEQKAVYVMGGFDGTRYYEGSTRFNLETLQWDETIYAPLNERRCYVNAARIDSEHILACGGYNNSTRMTSTEILDIKRNAWSVVAPMNIVRSDAHAVNLDGNIYVLGGFDGNVCHRSIEYYDPHSDQWTLVEREMRDKRSGVSALAINGVLMAVGGFTGRHRLNTVEFYDPREGLWHNVANMNLSRSNFGISSLRGNPIVVGGYDGHGTTEMCERFDWRANQWVNLPPLRFRRSALSLFCVDNLDGVERVFAGVESRL